VAKLSVPASALTRSDVLKSRRRAVIRNLNGQSIVQAWPKLKGPGKTPLQQAWVDRFSCLARARKSPFPAELDAAKFWVAMGNALYGNDPNGGLWYYRDALESAANGKFIRYQGEVRVTTPTVHVSRSAAENIPGGADTFLTPNTVEWDNNGFWSATLNPRRLTVKAPGLYLIGAQVTFGNIANGYREVILKQNGTSNIGVQRVALTTSQPIIITVLTVGYFHKLDYIEVQGGTTSLATTAKIDNFWLVAITPEALI